MASRRQILLRNFPERPFRAGFVSMVTHGEDMEFEVLAEHWHDMLRAAVASLHAEGNPRSYHWGSIGGSYIAFPIVYNYRHVLELYLKGMLVAGESALLLSGEQGVPDDVFAAHSFARLRPEIERLFRHLSVPYDPTIRGFRNRTEFRSLLSDLDSMEIRYPIDRRRQPSMRDQYMCFNLFEFAEIMDKVLDALNSLFGWIRYEADARCAAAYDY